MTPAWRGIGAASTSPPVKSRQFFSEAEATGTFKRSVPPGTITVLFIHGCSGLEMRALELNRRPDLFREKGLPVFTLLPPKRKLELERHGDFERRGLLFGR